MRTDRGRAAHPWQSGRDVGDAAGGSPVPATSGPDGVDERRGDSPPAAAGSGEDVETTGSDSADVGDPFVATDPARGESTDPAGNSPASVVSATSETGGPGSWTANGRPVTTAAADTTAGTGTGTASAASPTAVTASAGHPAGSTGTGPISTVGAATSGVGGTGAHPAAVASGAAPYSTVPVSGRTAPFGSTSNDRPAHSDSTGQQPGTAPNADMLNMLPALLSAMSGLGSGKGAGSGSGTSPQAQQARQALQDLADSHGTGDTTSPGTGGTTAPRTGGTGSGGGTGSSGSASAALNAKQIYQRTASTAFGNLDNKLVSYVNELGGVTSGNRANMDRLLSEVNTALSQIGPDATTVAGQYRVHALLATALHDAQVIAGDTGSSAAGTAAAINELTRQYVYNVSGQDYRANFHGSRGHGTFTASSTASSAAQQAISTAESELGKPYVYGAEGPNSFDCSGLVQYAAASAGVSIPRTASQQYQQLPKVNPADIRPGDLIFPAAEFNNGSPGHVMMYIGNGQCIEAPHTGDVVKIIGLPRSYAASRWS
ncbi:NlpC/P60 family protein [Nocardia sp. BMG111209]|uniref:NlpC/P60 family protein n=1 Tax=Nocardia sp. BMG111209 TaxID=1160137 RepID=UPI0012DDCB0B|nr:NlpC/P60 family protein [Nocardia sp. BMG111209]